MPRSNELVYPERRRCRACRSYFGFIVIRGQFCSYRCADMAEPSQDPMSWPRSHRYGLKEKRFFLSREEAEEVCQPDKGVYLCDYCGTWHIGGRRQ